MTDSTRIAIIQIAIMIILLALNCFIVRFFYCLQHDNDLIKEDFKVVKVRQILYIAIRTANELSFLLAEPPFWPTNIEEK